MKLKIIIHGAFLAAVFSCGLPSALACGEPEPAQSRCVGLQDLGLPERVCLGADEDCTGVRVERGPQGDLCVGIDR